MGLNWCREGHGTRDTGYGKTEDGIKGTWVSGINYLENIRWDLIKLRMKKERTPITRIG